MFAMRGPVVADAKPVGAFPASRRQMATTQPAVLTVGHVGLTYPAHRGMYLLFVRSRGHRPAFCTTSALRSRLSMSGVPSPVTKSYPGPALLTALPPRTTS